MLAAVNENLGGTDIFIAAAAVSDYRPVQVSTEKIKKTSDSLMLALSRTTDILATVAAGAARPFVVGFAAETQNVERNALAKLEGKNLDMIAANQVGEGLAFDQDDNALTVYWRGGGRELKRAREGADRSRAGRAHRRALREPGERRAPRQSSGRKRRGALIRLGIRDSIEAAEPAPSPGAGAGCPYRARLPAARVRDRRLGRSRSARLHRCTAHARARPGRAAADRDRDPSRGSGARRDAVAALGSRPQARHRARQSGRADRLRLPGPGDGVVLEPRRSSLHGRRQASASRRWSSCRWCRWRSRSSRTSPIPRAARAASAAPGLA